MAGERFPEGTPKGVTARARVRITSRSEADGCICRNDLGERLVEIAMPAFPSIEPGLRAVFDDIEELVVCESCVRQAARAMGLLPCVPQEDPGVQKLVEAEKSALLTFEDLVVKEGELRARVSGLEEEVAR